MDGLEQKTIPLSLVRYRMFGNLPGYAILDHHTHDTYWEHLSASIFCLAASGWGWGGRMKVSVTRGCIPVIIQVGGGHRACTAIIASHTTTPLQATSSDS